MKTVFLSICIIFLSGIFQLAWGRCHVLTSQNETAEQANDAIYYILSLNHSSCPKNIFDFRSLLKASGLKLDTTLVANRGFHNPSAGSFSIFEMASGWLSTHHLSVQSGDVFFGHFTSVKNNYLIADQAPKKDALMIEALAWDVKKKLYHFYELRGDGKQGQWFYRGDSADILSDNTFLHRQQDPTHPQFGNRLRCSACHDAGGPIMKELSLPHNDWWEPKRQLDFGGRRPDAELQEILSTLSPPERLANSVRLGIKRLMRSEHFNKILLSHSLQEQLRPLFCPVELNLMSDTRPNNENRDWIEIPAEFFVDSRLLPPESRKYILVSRVLYENALKKMGSHFPETHDADADHAWLTPVKAESDKVAIQHLILRGVIDEKWVLAILSVDMVEPVFSATRCGLLRFVPDNNTVGWQDQFIKNLSASRQPAAQQLAHQLVDSHWTVESYQRRALRFLTGINTGSNRNVEQWYRSLVRRRTAVYESEISANPLGQILEPGFRVIFPENK